MTPVLSLIEVSKHFGKTTAVDRAGFEVPKGHIYGILGPNGAGKTTTLRMVNNIMIPDEGTILIRGEPVSRSTQDLVGYLPEERGLYKKMKVFEQLFYLTRLKGLTAGQARRTLDYWLGRFEAQTWAKKEIGELSKGMQQKIQFIATIAHDPEICIFDEPFSGLDPINSELLKKIILELRDRGKSIIFATHRMEQVEQMCDYICLFNKGKVILEGKLDEIRRSYGSNTVQLSFSGDGSFIDRFDDVRVNNRSANFAEIRLLNGKSEQELLHEAIRHVDIQKFEFLQPSLNEIFISAVGKNNGSQEQTRVQTP
ncbi:MAG: ATP-binding cassette domain-containing protein [Balneolales bacterium]